MIKAALRRLRAVSGLEPDLLRRLSQTGLAFAEVSDHEYSPAALPEVSFTRLNRQWEAASRLSLLILRQETLKDETGKAIGTSFTVDMNVLFEKFIEEVVRQATNRAGLRLQPQERVNLTQQIEMRPDLVVHSGDRTVAVGDAKYIQLEPAGWPHAGLYQLLAYCVALGLPRGLLIYASSRPLEVHRVIGAGVELEIVGIDMSRPAKQLVEQAHVAARRLVGHARAVRLPAALPQP